LKEKTVKMSFEIEMPNSFNNKSDIAVMRKVRFVCNNVVFTVDPFQGMRVKMDVVGYPEAVWTVPRSTKTKKPKITKKIKRPSRSKKI
jgi:hypothetical protein